MSASAPPDPNAPWRSLPRLEGPAELVDVGPVLDDLFELPAGSALTLSRVEPATGRLFTARWRGSGGTGFYPASTIKWITAALTLAWMDGHDLEPLTVIQVGDDAPATLRDLLLDTLVLSGNHAFNTLQETVGLAETHAALRRWGVEQSVIRRFFVRPRRSNSRAVWVAPPGREPFVIAERPAADIPLNPAHTGSRESNYFTPDDFVRAAAATLLGPTRDTRHFGLLTQGLSWTNHCFVREGLAQVTADLETRPAFVVLNKPGWWPPDGDNSELCYVFDSHPNEHYLLAASIKGPIGVARQALSEAAFAMFSGLHAGRIRLDSRP